MVLGVILTPDFAIGHCCHPCIAEQITRNGSIPTFGMKGCSLDCQGKLIDPGFCDRGAQSAQVFIHSMYFVKWIQTYLYTICIYLHLTSI